MGEKTEIWAHRGASGYAPENTLEAFLMAVQMGADGVELDVQLSKDGELVVIHDETLERTSGVKGNVRDFTLAQLKELNVSVAYPNAAPTRIPTLEEALAALRDTDLKINIECKTGIFFYPKLEAKTVRLVKEMGMLKRVWFSSFNHQSVMKIKKLCPKAKTGFLLADVNVDAVSYARKNGVGALHPALYHMQDERLLARCHKKGIKVHVWTVNEKGDMERCARAGVDAIITNYPNIAREVVDAL